MKQTLLKFSLLLVLVLGGALTSQAAWKVYKSWDFVAFAAEVTDKDPITYSSDLVTCNKVGCNLGTGHFDGLAFQGADKWIQRKNSGVMNLNSGGRMFVVTGLVAEDQVVVTTTANGVVSSNGNSTLVSTEDNTTTYSVTADGEFYAYLGRNAMISKIEVSHNEVEVGEVYADYTVKFVDEQGAEIKDPVSHNGLVGGDVALVPSDTENFFNADKTKKYIYVSNDAEGMKIAETGTVVTVTFREAAKYTYTLKSTNPDKDLASGADFEGEAVTVCYPAFQLLPDSTLTKYAARTSKGEFNVILNLTQDVVETLAYTSANVKNVVMYAEAEDIMDVATGSFAVDRCSYGKGGYASQDTVVATLAPGKYKMTVSTRGGGARDYGFVFTVDGNTIYTTDNLMGYNQTGTSDEFEISKELPVVLLKAGGNADMIDYLYIQKTGEYVPPVIAAESVALDKETAELSIDETLQLTATVAPENTTDKTIVWASSDEAVATVSAEGLVTALAEGTASITATCGDAVATCAVTVSKIAQTITWDQAFDAVVDGTTIELTATASSQLAVAYEITEGADLATIEGNKLTVNAAGTIKVVAKQEGNEKYAAAQSVEKTINATSGIAEIEAADAQGEYYTLQGVRVAQPAAGAVYIRVAAGKAAKVYVK